MDWQYHNDEDGANNEHITLFCKAREMNWACTTSFTQWGSWRSPKTEPTKRDLSNRVQQTRTVHHCAAHEQNPNWRETNINWPTADIIFGQQRSRCDWIVHWAARHARIQDDPQNNPHEKSVVDCWTWLNCMISWQYTVAAFSRFNNFNAKSAAYQQLPWSWSLQSRDRAKITILACGPPELNKTRITKR